MAISQFVLVSLSKLDQVVRDSAGGTVVVETGRMVKKLEPYLEP